MLCTYQYFVNLAHIGHEECLDDVQESSFISENSGDNDTRLTIRF